MNVCIIDQGINHEKRHQIMVQVGSGFNHLFPGKLFTLEQAKAICNDNNYNIAAIGTVWECLK